MVYLPDSGVSFVNSFLRANKLPIDRLSGDFGRIKKLPNFPGVSLLLSLFSDVCNVTKERPYCTCLLNGWVQTIFTRSHF